ncbi:MAG: hypothetical protein RLZZ169_512 [Pseudomonadota bacterium]|jgi:hypothetical protein
MRWTGHHLNRSVQDSFDSGILGIPITRHANADSRQRH